VGRLQGQQHQHEVASIHDMVSFKQPDLDKKIVYDNWPRKSLVDHFLQPGLTLEKFRTCAGELGDFVTGVYTTRIRRSETRVEACMSRESRVGPYRIRLVKTVALDIQNGSHLEISYELENLPTDVPIHFGIEFNFAGMAAGASDRYYYDARGQQLGQLETVQSLSDVQRIGLIDEWLGLDTALEISRPADIWTLPIETISQSEGGFELVHQSSMVMPHWEFIADADGRWNVNITLAIDTSAAQAREHQKAAVMS
jgi:alpha-amylase